MGLLAQEQRGHGPAPLRASVPERPRRPPHILKVAGSIPAGGVAFMPRCAAFRASWLWSIGDVATFEDTLGIAYPQSSCGLVAMTSASHAEGRQFDPGQLYCSLAGDWAKGSGSCQMHIYGC